MPKIPTKRPLKNLMQWTEVEMSKPTMTLKQVRDSLRSQCEQVEKDENKYPECAYYNWYGRGII